MQSSAVLVGPDHYQKALTPRQFYEAIEKIIGINTIYDLVRTGRLRSVKIGNRRLIPVSEIHAFFERESIQES